MSHLKLASRHQVSAGRSHATNNAIAGQEAISPCSLTREQQRESLENVELVIYRYFAAQAHHSDAALKREAVARSVNAGESFQAFFEDELELADGDFGPELLAPAPCVEQAFRAYAMTKLGYVALKRLIEFDNAFIEKGWRTEDGMLTDAGIEAYGAGQWRPFRVASNGIESDTVTPSGAMMMPDDLELEEYSTGDIAHPLAIIHHELMAHVLPLKEAEGLAPGREMELICIRFESEMLRELGLRERALNWGLDDGTLDHTLHEPSEKYYYGLVKLDERGNLIEVDPESFEAIGPARFKK